MSKIVAGISGSLSTIFCLLTAFVLVKSLTFARAAELPRHMLVGAVLILLPVVLCRQSLSFFKTLFARAENQWGDWFCVAYLFVPIVALNLFFPEQWAQARIGLSRWVLSTPGISAVLLAPLFEEFFFRGWLLNFQLERTRLNAASTLPVRSLRDWFWICYVNALVFWIFHFPVHEGFWTVWMQSLEKGLVPLSPGPFFLGFMASVLTLFTGNPRSAVLFHALANALGPMWWPILGHDTLRSVFYF